MTSTSKSIANLRKEQTENQRLIKYQPVPYARADHSPPRRGAPNVSTLRVDQSCLQELVADHFRELIERLATEPVPRMPGSVDFDAFFERCREVVMAIEELQTRDGNDSTIVKWHTIQQLVREAPHELKNKVDLLLANAARNELRPYAEAAETVAMRWPQRLPSFAAHLRELLLVDVPAHSLEVFDGCRRLVEAVRQLRISGGAPLIRTRLLQRVQFRLAESLQGALEVYSREIARRELQKHKNAILKALGDYEDLTRKATTRLNAIQKWLNQHWRDQQIQATTTRTSSDVVIAGPTLALLRAKLEEAWESKTTRELIDKLLPLWIDALQVWVSNVYPTLHDVGQRFSKLLCVVPTNIAGQIWHDLVAERIRDFASSPYPYLAAQDVDGVARELVSRAAPLLDLGGREHYRLNVQPRHITVLRIPDARGENDPSSREAFIAAIRRAATSGVDVVSIRSNRPLQVLRVTVGFPIAVSATNASYAVSYVACRGAKVRHRPHLYGLLTGDGLPLKDCVDALAPHLQP